MQLFPNGSGAGWTEEKRSGVITFLALVNCDGNSWQATKKPASKAGFCGPKAGSNRDDPVVIIDRPRAGLVFPTPFAVIAVFWRTLQLLFSNAGAVSTQVGVIF